MPTIWASKIPSWQLSGRNSSAEASTFSPPNDHPTHFSRLQSTERPRVGAGERVNPVARTSLDIRLPLSFLRSHLLLPHPLYFAASLAALRTVKALFCARRILVLGCLCDILAHPFVVSRVQSSSSRQFRVRRGRTALLDSRAALFLFLLFSPGEARCSQCTEVVGIHLAFTDHVIAPLSFLYFRTTSSISLSSVYTLSLNLFCYLTERAGNHSETKKGEKCASSTERRADAL